MSTRFRAASTGVVAAAAGIGAAELLAALATSVFGSAGSPLAAVGGAVIDATPTPVKEFAVRTFGNWDKPLLLAGIGLVLAAIAALAGIVSLKRPWVGTVVAAALGLVGAVAAVTRPSGRLVDALPSLLAGAIAALVLRAIVPTRAGRRRFLVAALGSVAAFGAAWWLRRADPRGEVSLPAADEPAGPLVGNAGFYSRELYRVDTALVVPRIEIERWRLRVHGMVERPYEIDFADLIAEPVVERDITLNCVSNEVGGPYIGTARWLGVLLAPLLRRAGVLAGADQVVARSSEGMTIGTPVATVLDGRDSMLAFGMNGKPLPPQHGFPVRMLTPGLYGYAGSCKWLVELELATFDAFDAYWVRRGWAREAPVKTSSRIDRPAALGRIERADTVIAGVAWAQRRGIRAVEVRVDDGQWQRAELLPTASADTWVQWRLPWRAEPGSHTLAVRAIDGTGSMQVERRAPPFPDGSTGWHTIRVTVV